MPPRMDGRITKGDDSRIAVNQRGYGPSMENPEKLTCISILIADQVYRDEDTKNLVIAGTFNAILAPALPVRKELMTVLISVTNGQGKYKLELSIEHEQTGQTVVELSGPFEIPSPIRITDAIVRLRDIEFRALGKYWVTIKSDNEIIQQRPFWVESMPEEDPNGRG